MSARRARRLALALPILWLAACGGGGAGPGGSAASPGDGLVAQAALATETAEIMLEAESAASDVQLTQQVAPAFHLAPVELPAPDDTDATDNAASARFAARVQAVPADTAALDTRGLTVQALAAQRRLRALAVPDETATPMASGSAITTFTPAQIRAAYGLPALPPVGTAASALSASAAAQLGAGQTLYIVDALHDPNLVAELAAFNAKFGLPGCTVRSIAPTASLPLPAADVAEGCVLSVVHTTTAGAMTATPPAYDASWATEIALDVQWAHATAPLARIVVIEAPEASLTSLLGAIRLANAMGPGVVSMSFGTTEGDWTASVDSAFTGAGMTYVAATGDSGAAVTWPAVSRSVLAVGGTSLTLGGSGGRSETGWSHTGGGFSGYVALPAYQAMVPGPGALTRRAVADVAFNADPATGQYVGLMPAGATAVTWMSAGGTSLATPQWAGLAALANARRALAGRTAMTSVHALLYAQAASPGGYAAGFLDVTSGTNGTCSTCAAAIGYDPLTGLGTPQAGTLLTALAGSAETTGAPVTAPSQAPAVRANALAGVAGQPLSGTLVFKDPGGYAMRVTITGVPQGMRFSAAGQTLNVAWAQPVAGPYRLDLTVRNAIGLTTQASVTVTISAR